ncbi:MAG: tRNA (adenosine(37)-N6)-threonylcarbamoyltransferase complex dimerization subunit type 1 TsaB [Thermoanaerobacterales bacterium]|nr:tRNA (adenosine(37)-N6)-threonylcarbamoyltransferase complex dimerization subunit type 1 TsaB [Bacillota bacterium]MDI6907819.1 tRNA (adenosine(37)-N6)-threonylcarbamoyltransferase complex dimerization subunit type 1 TsaB [Thermoanaerobacterales bacterium]
MLVLGIETTGPVLSVGLTDGRQPLAETSLYGARIHSVRLLPAIKDLLAAAGRTCGDLTGVAVSRGPGSFTGLRIGLTVAKTLAQVLSLPAVGVSSLDVLAYPLTRNGGAAMALVPARRGEVYAALYEGPGEEPVVGPRNMDLAQLLTALADIPEGPLLCVGEAAALYAGELRQALGGRLRLVPPALNHPRGAVVAQLGVEHLARGEADDPLQLQPVYLRLSAAEMAWQARCRGEQA